MTEKEYRNLINEIEIKDDQRQVLNKILSLLADKINGYQNDYLNIFNFRKYGSIQTNTAISPLKNINIAIESNVDLQLNDQLKTNILFNNVENEIAYLGLNVSSFERDYEQKTISIKIDEIEFKIKITNEDFIADKYLEELNNRHTYFKNVLKIIKHYVNEQKLNIPSYLVMILLAYGAENYLAGRKYEDYFVAFDKALDDFIAKKKIELLKTYNFEFVLNINEYKGFVIVDPFSGDNVASKVNDVNVQDYRKLKKSLTKLFEVIQIDTRGNAIVTLDVTPILNPSTNKYAWSYQLVGRGLSSSGGEYENNQFEFKTAVLKGLFRGLKTTIEQIKNKNITIICPVGKVLECVAGKAEEAENNSRRKTITKLIEENKLLIKWETKR